MKTFLRKYYPYLLVGLASFFIGAYVWKVANTGQETVSAVFEFPDQRPRRNSVIVEVGKTQITSEDLDFEYNLHTRGIFASDELTPIPDLGAKFESELSPLKEGLLSSMIERRLLFYYVKEHTDFNLADPNRYVSCLEEWQQTVQDETAAFGKKADQDRLKTRLCEKSLLDQYIEEKMYSDIQISPAEIEAYYQSNLGEFNRPRRVLIRQIVLPDENAAKKARHGLNRGNFVQRARELSITPEAQDGGLLGPFAKGELPRVFDIAFTMRQSDIYGILKSTYGFHLIMLEKKYPAEKLTLEQATASIKNKLLLKKKEEAFQRWIETALDTVPVKAPTPLW